MRVRRKWENFERKSFKARCRAGQRDGRDPYEVDKRAETNLGDFPPGSKLRAANSREILKSYYIKRP